MTLAWQCGPVIPAAGRLRKEDRKSKSSLDTHPDPDLKSKMKVRQGGLCLCSRPSGSRGRQITSFRSVRVTWQDPVLNKQLAPIPGRKKLTF